MHLLRTAFHSLSSLSTTSQAEHARLTGQGVVFTQPPTDIGTAVIAVFDDTCGNLIQLVEVKPDANQVTPAELPPAPQRSTSQEAD